MNRDILHFRYLCIRNRFIMKQIPLYKFHKRKYGTELLIDVLDLDYIKTGIRRNPVHRETFYCIILITDGREEVTVNEHTRFVQAKDVICSRPGEIWHWQPDPKLEGLVLIFEEPFLLSFFNDPHFLDRFAYLQANRTSPFLHFGESLNERFRSLLMQMKTEIDDYTDKDQHILRAMLYEALVLLNRAEKVEDSGQPMNDISTSRYINGFIHSVEAEYMMRHEVEYYADKLCITPNYLNKIVRQSLGTTAKAYIHQKLFAEAKRLLSYTILSVTEIAEWLHFDSASHFVRFFRKHADMPPLQYRQSINSPQK
ncbi:helix-turn-helix domain-containing protein [Xylanibacter muris]|uniref:AraC family transcriptional regulator n=2 Tax=Xylanibacter muris TaxID=2736290 RepID=A0ABX2AKL1_9BACT|nr:helix-turn-helix domain-containing protein [Xylanibacter muris]NPD91584.1 AraC family transcriptional regulator [Xylanibacter muris]